MFDQLIKFGIASYVSQDVLIVPFQSDFYPEVIEALRTEILNKLHNMQEVKGFIIDVSQVTLLGLSNMDALEKTLNMVNLLGVKAYLVGVRPSVALTLVELGYEGSCINVALDVQQAMTQIHQSDEQQKEESPPPEEAGEPPSMDEEASSLKGEKE